VAPISGICRFGVFRAFQLRIDEGSVEHVIMDYLYLAVMTQRELAERV